MSCTASLCILTASNIESNPGCWPMLAEPKRCEAFNVLSLQLCIATAKKTPSTNANERSPSGQVNVKVDVRE